jgi:hypothetical protein
MPPIFTPFWVLYDGFAARAQVRTFIVDSTLLSQSLTIHKHKARYPSEGIEAIVVCWIIPREPNSRDVIGVRRIPLGDDGLMNLSF